MEVNFNKHHTGYYGPKSLATMHEFYLNGEIGPSEDYTDWFDCIRHANENDVVKIYINSVGGNLFTAIQFMRVLSDTQATVVCSVEGACMSAATMIFMCADNFEVTPHSVFMFHDYSGGTIGKGGEMIAQLQHERKWSERLMNEVYHAFMTQDEIKAIVEGKDHWMDGEEVVKRMDSRTKKLTKAHNAKEKVSKTTEKANKTEKQSKNTKK